ncbi:MAG TPA: hypothetical protein VJ810_15365 [Blastocatellia bacterium]|nr:hypothetical protein [Blastocatellia bacterium]
MKSFELKQICALVILLVASLALTGCDDDFYLSEHEVEAYSSIFASEATLNLHFDNLQGRAINLTFDNSTGTPRVQSTNLLTEMRRTELAQLETGSAAVSLARLSAELETQVGNWIEGRLQLYTSGAANDRVRLTGLDNVSVVFINNPSFTYHPERQTIAFDGRVQLVMNGVIEVNAVNWLINIFTNINGTYSLQALVPDLRLQGEASVYSPFANAGRIRFQMIPQIQAPVQVLENAGTIPNQVKQGVAQVLTHNLSVRVDEVFTQDYYHFTLPQIRLTSQNPSRLEVSYRSKADWLGPDAARPQMHLVTRALDGKLYHARKSNGGWSGYTAVPFPSPGPTPYPPIYNDPTLVHSGNNQLELTATNQSGDLIYAHYRDEEWGATRIVRPNAAFNPAISYRGKPAVAASAPGQAEIVVAGSDGSLWHHRRINGSWLNPARVPLSGYPLITAPYRDPTAVYVGNKIVVVFADSQNRLAAIAFDLETSLWGQPTMFLSPSNTQTTIVYAPAAVASGERRVNSSFVGQVDVVYVKSGGSVFHRVLEIDPDNFVPNVANTGIVFRGNETSVGGATANATPVLTCSTYLQPELIVRGTDNWLRHNHFVYALAPYTVDGRLVNPGWQGWSLLTDNFFTGAQKTDGRVSEFAAAGTRTGKTELAARAYTTYIYSTQLIFHNEYESGRYGRATAPWKTVHWRGWEAIGEQVFLGRPALVAVDRNFQLAHIGVRAGFGSTVHVERLAETNATYLLGSTSAVSANPVIDPITFSTGPGMFDTIALRKDGKPEHTRHFSNGSGYPVTLSTPTGVTLTALSAATYGNGFVELAAHGSDNRIYHWRYRGGVWSQPAAVANQIISAPILMSAGAGQLELLGVDLDYHLFRWRFVDAAWQPRLSVAHDFRINNTLFSSLSASSWGDGAIDLVVVGLDTRNLYHRRIGPGNEICTNPSPFPPVICPAPRVFSNLGGSIMDDPVLTAFSPTRLNVLTMQGLKWHSIWASRHPIQLITIPAPPDPRLLWSGFEYIGGDEMVVGGAAHTGRNSFVAVAVRDGQFYINRNADGRWTGFQPLIGQDPGQILHLPIFLPAIAAHGAGG